MNILSYLSVSHFHLILSKYLYRALAFSSDILSQCCSYVVILSIITCLYQLLRVLARAIAVPGISSDISNSSTRFTYEKFIVFQSITVTILSLISSARLGALSSNTTIAHQSM